MAEKDKVSVKSTTVGSKEKEAQPEVVETSKPKPKPAVPAFRIVSAKGRKRFINALFYGDYGVGKSTLAATASEVPEMQSVLYINAEAGDESIKGFDVDLVDIYNFGQFARVHEFLRLHCGLRDKYIEGDKAARDKLLYYEEALKGEAGDEPTVYFTTVIDSLTEVQKYCMYQLLGIQIGQQALDLEPDQPEWTEWGKSAEMIRLLVRTFRDLPMHTLMVCGRNQEQDERKRYHYGPLLPGKLSNEVQGFFDIVGYMVAGPTEGGEMHRRLYLEPGVNYKAKNRFREFDERYIDSPSMADIIKWTVPQNKEVL